jgi:AAA ATPase domain
MPSLVGRERELRAALSAYAGARDASSATTLLVGGPSGIGKSALADAFADAVTSQSCVFRVRAYQRESTVPAALANRLPAELEQTLASQTSTVVLVVDDAHWSDPESLERLAEITRRFSDRAFAIVFTHCDENARELPFSIDRRILLGELGTVAARSLARALYAAGDDVLDAIVQAGRGIPYELVTIASAAQRRGVTDGRSVDHSARAAIARSLSAMPAEQRTFLQLLSLLHEPVEIELAGRLLPGGGNVDAFIAALDDEYLLRDGAYLHFRHELTASAILETIAMRIPLHRRILDAIERGGTKRIEDRQLFAEHALASGDQALARSVLLELAFFAARAAQAHAVIWASERFMRLDEPPAEQFVDFYAQFFTALTETKQNQRALSIASHALSEAQRRGLRGLGTLAGQLVLAQWSVDRHDAARASYERYTRAFIDPTDLEKLREAAPWARVS